MEECEICGKATAAQYAIEIEGAEMLVCLSCAGGKQVTAVYGMKRDETAAQKKATARREESSQEELIDNYGGAIRKAREALGLPAKVVAERINEKESTLIRVEKEKMLPSLELVKKLEKELGIKLISVSAVTRQQLRSYRKEELTFDDVAVKKEKK